MKKIFFTLIAIAGVVSIALIYSCKKSDSTTNPGSTASLDSNDKTFNDDNNFSKTANDQINTDINNDLSGGNTSGMRRAGPLSFQSYARPCGCNNVDTSMISQKKLVYYFDGTSPCYGCTRSGSITVQLAPGDSLWENAGSVLIFSTTDFKVTRLSDGKWATFSGTKYLTNVNGSSFWQWLYFLAGKATIQVRERALGVNVTFSGGATAVWNSAAIGTWSVDTLVNGKPVYFTATSDTTIGPYSNICNWGINRFGQNFVTHFTSNRPLTWDSNCGPWQPVNGQWTHEVTGASLKVTYGVNSNGTQFNDNGVSCPWGWSIEWSLPNSTGTANFPYL